MRIIGAVSIVGMASGVIVMLVGSFQPAPLCVAQVGQPTIACPSSLAWPLVMIGSAIVLLSALGLAWSMRGKLAERNEPSPLTTSGRGSLADPKNRQSTIRIYQFGRLDS